MSTEIDTLRRELMRLEALDTLTPAQVEQLNRLIERLQALQPQAENARKWAEMRGGKYGLIFMALSYILCT